jgi:hypothetical protein
MQDAVKALAKHEYLLVGLLQERAPSAVPACLSSNTGAGWGRPSGHFDLLWSLQYPTYQCKHTVRRQRSRD